MIRWLTVLVVLCSIVPIAKGATDTVRIGSKDFTEQEILGELVAQLIEKHTGLKVIRQFGLGGTDMCHRALLNGELDIYVEYTGTGLLNVLKEQVISDPDAAFRKVAGDYRTRFDLEWLPPLGFNNTYAITVRGDQADRLGLASISDLKEHAGKMRGGFTSEFMERPDGYPGLKQTYGFALRALLNTVSAS